MSDSVSDSEEQLLERLRTGDAPAIAALVHRDHALAEMCARVLAGPAGPGPAVTRAWESLLADIATGEAVGPLRAALLSRLVCAMAEAGALDDRQHAPPPAPGPFLSAADDERWAGWYAADPVGWPYGATPEPAHVEGALRALPAPFRLMLLLVDAAGVAQEDAWRVLETVRHQPVPLEAARDAFVAYVDREVRG